MSWWKTLFVSRHVLFLEAEYKKLQDRLESELAYERQLNKELREDIDRLRLFLHPGLQRVDLHPDTTPASEDPAMKREPSGNPWQRIQAREMAADAARYEAAQAKKKLDRESGKTEPKGAN